MNISHSFQPDVNVHLTRGRVQLPVVQLLLVGENMWQQGYGCSPTGGDPSWVAFRTISGAGSIEFKDGRSIDLAVGTVVLFRECDLERYQVTADHWGNYWYQFEFDKPEMLPANQLINAPEEPGERIKHQEITFGVADESVLNRMMANVRFLDLLITWLATSGQALPTPEAGQYVENAIRIMHDHLCQNISVSCIARRVGVSEARLRKLFSERIGVSPKKYYNLTRMYEARRLLVAGKSVQQVGEQLGYSDQFHFSRAFKNHFHRSPQVFVRQLHPGRE